MTSKGSEESIVMSSQEILGLCISSCGGTGFATSCRNCLGQALRIHRSIRKYRYVEKDP